MVIRQDTEALQTVEITLNSKLKGWNEVENSTLFYHGWCPEVVEPSYYECVDPVRYSDFETTRSIKFEAGVKVWKTDGDIVEKEGKLVIEKCKTLVLL